VEAHSVRTALGRVQQYFLIRNSHTTSQRAGTPILAAALETVNVCTHTTNQQTSNGPPWRLRLKTFCLVNCTVRDSLGSDVPTHSSNLKLQSRAQNPTIPLKSLRRQQLFARSCRLRLCRATSQSCTNPSAFHKFVLEGITLPNISTAAVWAAEARSLGRPFIMGSHVS
jgi:hypothetical protein